jgi:hypothetical protein
VAGLENGSDLAGEWLAALVALVSAYASALALHLGNAIEAAAMRANGSVRPHVGFNPSVSCFLVVKMALIQDRHDQPLVRTTYSPELGTSSIILGFLSLYI